VTGFKHLIQCHCILPQFKNKAEPIFHKFIVFSVIDDKDKVIPKYSHCNNCGVVHRVFDLCKSEIVLGKESIRSMLTKEDIRPSLPTNISSILDTYECDLPIWEEVHFIIDNKRWGSSVVLTKDILDDTIQGKNLSILGQTEVKIETFIENLLLETQ